MREFKLINSKGEEYDFCRSCSLLISPDGLGFEKSFENLQVGSAFIMAESDLNQQAVTGEIVFKTYKDYSDFARFIAQGNLILAYRPRDFSNWYYRSCEVKSLKKSEISPSTHRLHCNVDFLCFSQWYESAFAEKTKEKPDGSTEFTFTFPFTFVDMNSNEVNINNSNISPAPCKIEILGPCVNPKWTLTVGKRIVSTGEVFISLTKNEKLIIDANIESMRIVKAKANTETNVYQLSNFETERFIYAPSGKSTLSFTHDSGAALDVTVEVRKVADTI